MPSKNLVPLWKVLHSRKVQSLSGDAFKAWINLIALACELDNGGELPRLSDIAFALRLDDEKTKHLICELVEHNLLESLDDSLSMMDDTFRIHDWNEWRIKPDTSTERMRRYRERKKKMAETPKDGIVA